MSIANGEGEPPKVRPLVNFKWTEATSLYSAPSGPCKVCTRCQKLKPLDLFHRDRSLKDGRRAYCKECLSEYYRSRPDKNKEQRKIYRDNNREKIRKIGISYRSTTRGQASALHKTAQQRATKLGVPFSLPPEWVIQRILYGKCEVTDLPFDIKQKGKRFLSPFAPSIDRIDPAEGYVPSNCRMVVWGYNAAKGQGNDDDVLKISIALVRKYFRETNL